MSWVAMCNGKRYVCSAGAGLCTPEVEEDAEDSEGVDDGDDVDKSTEAPASSEKQAAPVGCQYDNQCKGDRICVNGACVDPKPAQP